MTDQLINTSLLESIMILKGFKNRGEFAKTVGVNPTTISSLFNNKHQPSGKLINAIYKELDLTSDELVKIFYGEETK